MVADFKEKGVLGILFFSFVISLPYVSAFSVSPVLPMPLILGGGLFFILLYKKKIYIVKSDLFFVALILVCIIPYVWSYEYLSEKQLIHLLALIVVVLVFYFSTRSALYYFLGDGGPGGYIGKVFSLSLFILSIFVIVEFSLANYFGYPISKFVSYSVRPEYHATISHGIIRARGGASESGHMAIFFGLAAVASYPYISSTSWWKWLYWPIVALAYVLLFSVASFLLLSFVVVVFFLLLSLRNPLSAIFYLLVFVFLILVAEALFGEYVRDYLVYSLLPKLGLVGDGVGSMSARIKVYDEVLSILSSYPFGIGFGVAASASQMGGYYDIPLSAGHISMLGLLLVAGGVVGGVIYLYLVGVHFYRAAKVPKYALIILAGSVLVSGHYFVVGDFYLPYLWVYWAYVDAMYRCYSGRSVGGV